MILQPTTPELFVGLPQSFRRKVVCPKYTFQEIAESILSLYNKDYATVFSKTSKAEFVKPRMIIIYLTCKTGEYTLIELSKISGLRDHSNVIYNRDTVKERMEVDKLFRAEIERAVNVVIAKWDAMTEDRTRQILSLKRAMKNSRLV